MVNINSFVKYFSLLLLLLSFIIELYIVGFENRGNILMIQYFVLYSFFLLIFIFGNISISPFFRRILIFLALLIFLGLFSSDLVVTYNYIAKFTAGLLFFVIGYNFFINEKDIKIILQFSMIMISIGLIIVFYNNYTERGISLYKNEFYGISKSNTYNVFSILISFLFSQIAIFSKKQKIILLILSFASILILIFIFKRTPFIILFSSILILIYFNSTPRNFRRVISSLSVLAILLIYFYPLYEEQLNKNILARQRKFEIDLTEEGRYKENIVVVEKIKQEPLTLILGTGEVFNSRDKSYIEDRMLHNDYANILWSTGLFGFFLFFGNFFFLLIGFWRKRKLFATNNFLKNIATSGIILVISYLICALGQAWTSITILGVIMLYSGFCLRIISLRYSSV